MLDLCCNIEQKYRFVPWSQGWIMYGNRIGGG
jgi:hypothetical protein